MNIFADFNFENFWNNNEYAQENYISEPFSDKLLAEIQNELGFKLPQDYIEFMCYQNGGIPFNLCYPTETRTSWAEDHIAISGIFGIGKIKYYSLCGEAGNQLWIEEWEYPDDCVYFANCPSGGHDMLAFDYSECGRDGEPCIVHIDQELDYHKTFLAKDFATFVKGLKHDDDFDF